jgi:hypothetical protein
MKPINHVLIINFFDPGRNVNILNFFRGACE